MDKTQKAIALRNKRLTAKFLQLLAGNKLQDLPDIEAKPIVETPSEWWSTFAIVLSNKSQSGVDLRGLVVTFPVDDTLKNGLQLQTYTCDDISYPGPDSKLEIQGDPGLAVSSIYWPYGDWVNTILKPDETFKIIYGVGSFVTQANLDAVISGNIRILTGELEYKLTVIAPERPRDVNKDLCAIEVRHSESGHGKQFSIPWGSSVTSDGNSQYDNLPYGSYTVRPSDIIVRQGSYLYQGNAQTVELTANSPEKTVVCSYRERLEFIRIVLSVDSDFASYSKIVEFTGINGNFNNYSFEMEGRFKIVRIFPGEYNISSRITGEKLYEGKFNNPYNLTKDQGIQIEYEELRQLVKGWPPYIAHGAITDGGSGTIERLKQCQMDAIFKYAGNDGGGDRGLIVVETNATNSTITGSREIERATGRPVMPVMVVYTINASGDTTNLKSDLSMDEESERNGHLWKHYVNLSRVANRLQLAKDDNHPYPGSIILNPDAMGELQKGQHSTDETSVIPEILNGPIPVSENLRQAIEVLREDYDIVVDLDPSQLGDNFKGYVQSLHALIRAIAPDITFGWQVNLWASGTSIWVHDTLSEDEVYEKYSNPLINFWNDQEVYNGYLKPDFIVFDKWERDSLEYDSRIQGHVFNPNGWLNYMVYTKQITRGFGVPCMYWQIEGGHMPLVGEDTSIIDNEHGAIAPEFFYGNPGIGTDINNISREVLELGLIAPPAANPYNGAETVEEHLLRTPEYNWSNSQLEELANNEVFAILWGGGNTISITNIDSNIDVNDDGWLAGKVADYYKSPQYFPR